MLTATTAAAAAAAEAASASSSSSASGTLLPPHPLPRVPSILPAFLPVSVSLSLILSRLRSSDTRSLITRRLQASVDGSREPGSPGGGESPASEVRVARRSPSATAPLVPRRIPPGLQLLAHLQSSDQRVNSSRGEPVISGSRGSTRRRQPDHVSRLQQPERQPEQQCQRFPGDPTGAARAHPGAEGDDSS